MTKNLLIILSGLLVFGQSFAQEFASGQRIDGYKLIWFELGQKSEYGDKYSGGLGTYTAKHHPMAIYSKAANKTFFVYGGTTGPEKRELLAMLSYYDHTTGQVPKPVIVHAKKDVNDPHDNPSIQMDKEGHLWIFVSGRGNRRSGYIYKSAEPYSIDRLVLVREGEFAYPQPTYVDGSGFLFLFTKYTNGRELYWSNSADGLIWTDDQMLATEGHYQMTNQLGSKVATAFNAHPGNNDKRTNLYYLQTTDMGKTWTTVEDTPVETPVTGLDNPALIRDYQSEGRLVYLKDINFDTAGNPVLLYITSNYHETGPEGEPRIWTIAHWHDGRWLFHDVTRSTHNYDMGSLYTEADGTWRIIGPTEAGPQKWGTGGEMANWVSNDHGKTWKKERDITRNSTYNHSYARRPVSAHPDFYAFWADGNADEFSESRLHSTNRTGDSVWQLPYDMSEDLVTPVSVEINE